MMQQALIAALERAMLNMMPRLEPLLMQAATNIIRGLVIAAKNGTLPDRYKWAEPIIDDVGDQILAALQPKV
jgi:hypothetical protein